MLFFSLLGFGLRLHNLDFQPLWGDEGWSFYFATQPLSRLLALTAIDIHPPFYYILLKGWLAFGGIKTEMARFLSVVSGTLLIPTLYVLGRRLFEYRVGLLGAAVTSLMPLAIYYSQEVRMYGLVTLLGALSVYYFVRWRQLDNTPQQETGANLLWPGAYMLTMATTLYTHYYAALLFLFHLIYVSLAYVSVKKQFSLNRLAAMSVPLIGVVVLYLPWLFYVTSRLPDYVANKRNVEGYLPLNFIRFFGDHFVAFSVGHLPVEPGQYIWTALPFILVASLGFMTTLYFNKNKPYAYLFLYLFTPLLIGYGINQLFPFNPAYFERTLLLAAPAYWLFIATGIIWLWDRQYLVVGTVVLAMLIVTGVSLVYFYAVPRYRHEDYRPLLKQIAALATPEDTILASYQWQLGFYRAYLPEPQPRLFTAPGWGAGWAGEAGQSQLVRDLNKIFDGSPRLWFPAYQASGHIWEDQAEAVINRLGYPTLLQWYGPQTKMILAGTPKSPLTDGPTANFDNRLQLLATKVGTDTYQAGRGVIPIELIWQKINNLGSEHRVSLRLADTEGRTWATRDSHPQGGQAFFTDLAVDETLTDRHGLLLPAGTPPGVYRLLLSARRVSDAHPLDLVDAAGQPLGAELLLTEVEVVDPISPLDPAALPVQFVTEAVFGHQARLVGYTLGEEPFKAGDRLPLTLFWQSLADQPEPLTVSVELQDASGQAVVSHQQEPIRATTTWQDGTLLRDPQETPLPPTLPPGEYQLTLALLTADKTPLPVKDQERLLLTTVTTVDRPHVFEPPDPQIDLAVSFGDQARLVGVDLPQTRVKGGAWLPLTLYWQDIKTFNQNWTVFVHLVDGQGQIVSQQDQIPGGGQFPTTSWLPNEYLTDSYTLFIPTDLPPGDKIYQLKIGLYDVNNSIRLPVMAGGKIVSDHIVLENWQISVE